ncbi:hypothetical protein B566_EDAN003943 [Ephemera danica]|nr:hypothetical protein B566_EDAN003943 [Ephemera danica]
MSMHIMNIGDFTLLTLLPLVVLAVETPVPERFLAPRDFNPHPITDVRRPEPTYKRLNIPGPAEIYSHYNRQPAYKGQEYNQYAPQQLQQRLAQYSGQQHQQETAATDHGTLHQYSEEDTAGHYGGQDSNQQDYHDTRHDDTYDEQIPKQYAFSYSVLDHHSGDDFSHAQQHDGHSTEGQYRVKLPDGRVQVVRYTADKGGYRAKVSYEPSTSAEQEIQVKPTPHYYRQSYATPVENRYTAATPTTPQYHSATPTAIPASYSTTPTPYPYTIAYKSAENHHQQYQYNNNAVTEQPAFLIHPTYPSPSQHFGGTEPRVQVEYNGGGGTQTTIEPSHVLFEQHHVYKRDHR